MPDKLAQIIKIFTDGLREDYGERVAALVHGGLQVWRKTKESVGLDAKDDFRNQSIALLQKHAHLRIEDARTFVKGFLDALDEQLPGFWEIEQE